MVHARWERVRTELRSVRSRVLATTIAFLPVTLLAGGGDQPLSAPVDLDETERRNRLVEDLLPLAEALRIPVVVPAP